MTNLPIEEIANGPMDSFRFRFIPRKDNARYAQIKIIGRELGRRLHFIYLRLSQPYIQLHVRHAAINFLQVCGTFFRVLLVEFQRFALADTDGPLALKGV